MPGFFHLIAEPALEFLFVKHVITDDELALRHFPNRAPQTSRINIFRLLSSRTGPDSVEELLAVIIGGQ
jgi:hypothetical protein